MSRLVRVPHRTDVDYGIEGLDQVLAPSQVVADTYLERIAKYVPGEVLAFFIFINVILEQAVRNGGKTAMMAGIPVILIGQGMLVLGILLTPLFVWYVREEGDAWITNAFVSTLAFPFWVYALGAVAFDKYWDGNFAAILLAGFTVVSGLFSPRGARRGRKEKIQNPTRRPTRPERSHLDLVESNSA